MSALSDRVLQVVTTYLGPASKMFLERQTKFHLQNLAYDDLRMEHLPELFKWIHISSTLVIKDKSTELLGKLEMVFNIKRSA